MLPDGYWLLKENERDEEVTVGITFTHWGQDALPRLLIDGVWYERGMLDAIPHDMCRHLCSARIYKKEK